MGPMWSTYLSPTKTHQPTVKIRGPHIGLLAGKVFLPVDGFGLDLDFMFTEKTILVLCLTSGLKQESDCLCLFGTGSVLDSYSKFAKEDWIRSQKNWSPPMFPLIFCSLCAQKFWCVCTFLEMTKTCHRRTS